MSDVLDKAVQILKDGGLVGIPTETVYGLAGDAANASALQKIYSTKGRPAGHPLIVHIACPVNSLMTADEAKEAWRDSLSVWSRDVSPQALLLACAFWPGPLTMILPKAKSVLSDVTGGQETVGIRSPNHPIAQNLLKRFDGGLAAPSANKFGRISPTSAHHVHDEFGEDLLVLDGGDCQVGIESTIVDLSRWDTHGSVVLRPGAISKQEIETVLGQSKLLTQEDSSAPRVSGSLSAHYAPKTKLILWNSKISELASTGLNIAWVHFPKTAEPLFLKEAASCKDYLLSEDAKDVARRLYALLRELDKGAHDLIIFEELPIGEAWEGIQDRLRRAAVGSGLNDV
jgi:L-threonylcarbamoyladenylate synthase